MTAAAEATVGAWMQDLSGSFQGNRLGWLILGWESLG